MLSSLVLYDLAEASREKVGSKSTKRANNSSIFIGVIVIDTEMVTSTCKEMQRANGTSACASCKHQRKKCTEKCILAPFFPVDKTREFRGVHKVFGVSNVTKMVTNLEEEDRKRAVDSLIWEAFCRQKDPVLGPYGEYRRVCEELRLYQIQYQVQNQYKAAAQGLMGWNNSKFTSHNGAVINNNVNNSSLNNVQNNGNSLVEFYPYSYSTHHIQETDKLRGERDNGSALIVPQQHLPNGFNQQYFVTGQYNQIDSMSLELMDC